MLVTGAKGMLGADVCLALGERHTVYAFDVEEMDVTDGDGVMERFAEVGPEIVLHTAAYTDVESAELNPERAYAVNRDGTLNVALACRKYGALLVYISTDFVFDGTKGSPYVESDPPCPLNVYGMSKLAGEECVRRNLPLFFIVRTAWLYGRHGENFVANILKKAEIEDVLYVVDDKKGSPTYTGDLARALGDLIASDASGTFHIANSGSCSRFELASAALELSCINGKKIIPVKSREDKLRRPKDSSLKNFRLNELGLARMRPWRDALCDYLRD